MLTPDARAGLAEPPPDIVEEKITSMAQMLAAPFDRNNYRLMGVVVRISPQDRKQHIYPVGYNNDEYPSLITFSGANFNSPIYFLIHSFTEGKFDGLCIRFESSEKQYFPVCDPRVEIRDGILYFSPITSRKSSNEGVIWLESSSKEQYPDSLSKAEALLRMILPKRDDPRFEMTRVKIYNILEQAIRRECQS